MKNKTFISLVIASIMPLAVTTTASAAALANGDILVITPGVTSSTSGGAPTVVSGSWFAMGGNVAPTSRTALAPHDNLTLGITQYATGSHSGAPDGSESPGIDIPWDFYGNTGMDFTSNPANATSTGTGTATVDMSGWTVNWNGGDIAMGSGSWTPSGPPAWNGQTFVDGVANVTCSVDCSVGNTFQMYYTATVPTGSFAGVQYALYLTGTIATCGTDSTVPTVVGDTYNVATNSAGYLMPVLNNDSDTGCTDPSYSGHGSGIDKATVAITTQPTHGTVSVDPNTGVVTYIPTSSYIGSDSFVYTVKDVAGNTSSPATVSINVGPVAPTCVSDSAIDSSPPNPINFNVLTNDVTHTSPIDATSVDLDPATAGQQTSFTTANGGSVIVNSTGNVTYTPASGYTGADTFQYTVSDDGTNGTGSPLTCAAVTDSVLVTNKGTPIGGVANAYLSIKPGNVTNVNQQPAAGSGSWFSMELKPPNGYSYTSISGLNGIQLGTTQAATTAGSIIPNIDEAWLFNGALGVDQTTSPANQLSNDGAGNATVDFSGWNVSWNAIASIPMNAGPVVSGYTPGIAKITCAKDCSNGDTYTLDYSATVPQGDPSGFGGVHYFLHLEGTISQTPPLLGCQDSAAASDVTGVSVIDDCTAKTDLSSQFVPGDTATAVGNTTGIGLTATDIGSIDPLLNPSDGQMCVGGCVDFRITNLPGDHADIVVKLSKPIPNGGVYRKMINGRWKNFDTSGNDAIGSAPLDSATGNCPQPTGTYSVGLRTGNQCLFLKIYDGGPNDADGTKNGTILDPGGVLLPGSPNVPSSSSSGCSISKTPVKLSDRADWIVVALFMAVLGISRRRLGNKK